MTIAVNQAINNLPYYTQKRGNRLAFCCTFHSAFLFLAFQSLCYYCYRNFGQ